MSQKFEEALRGNSIKNMQNVPKSDLHNNAGRGGNIQYIEAWANVSIIPPAKPFESLLKMQEWFENNVKCYCSGIQGYLKRIEAAFVQASNDNITPHSVAGAKWVLCEFARHIKAKYLGG